jgi:L-arabinokinase
MPASAPARAGQIVLYASDHGFGHAARMLALAARLAEEGHAVTLCAGAATAMIQAAIPSLPRPIDVAHASVDPGLVARPSAVDFDLERSRERLSAWRRDLPRFVDAEAERLCRLSPSLVLADAPAVAIAAAARAGIPSVVCSNFTWLDMYAGRFGAEIDEALAGAYRPALFGLRLALGRMPLAGLSRVVDVPGALARRPRRSRAEVRRELGVEEDERMIGIGLGKSFDESLGPALASSAPTGVRLLVPAQGALAGAQAGPLVRFPSITSDPQDYFGACDLVLAKAGYSTLAEAAIAGVPLAVFPFAASPESARLAEDVGTSGLGIAFEDEAEARRALGDPDDLIARAHSAHHGPLPDAAPLLVRALRDEGLLGPALA